MGKESNSLILNKMRKFKHTPTNREFTVKEIGCNAVEGITWGNWEIPMWILENGQDWEEVVEKDYEILSFISTDKAIGEKPNVIRYISEEQYSIEDYLYKGDSVRSGAYLIHSVKRLSDGEIFTIDDKVNMFKGVAVITSFRILPNNEFVIDFDNRCSTISLKNLTKTKQPLFTTEDGIGVFCGDSYWFVNTAPHLWSIWKQTAKERTSLNKEFLAFSTKELAEDYLLMNKPILSLKDVFNILDRPLYKNHSNLKYIEEFKKEARNKII